jgi:hypothetical protein
MTEAMTCERPRAAAEPRTPSPKREGPAVEREVRPRRTLENIAADIPLDLKDADDRLRLYGRWAMDRWSPKRCGSAEKDYQPTRGEAFQARREPRELLMPSQDALRCQRALARVPELYRVVLALLYIPHRLPPQAQLRQAGIPPRLSRERHLYGLRMFDNIHGTLNLKADA